MKCTFFWSFIGFFLYIISIWYGKEFTVFIIIIFFCWCHLFQISACFIDYNINAFNNFSKSLIIPFVCFTSRWITKKYSFICSGFKLTKFFIGLFDETFSSKNSEVFYSRSLPYQSSYGVSSLFTRTWALLIIFTAACVALPQKVSEVWDSSSIARAIFWTVLFILFVAPFCWGVLAKKNCLFIPRCSQIQRVRHIWILLPDQIWDIWFLDLIYFQLNLWRP